MRIDSSTAVHLTNPSSSGAAYYARGLPLLDVRRLTVEFDLGRRKSPLRALDDVSLTVAGRETVGVVGESGSGKSTLGRAILGLAPIASGSVFFDGAEITNADYRDRQRLSAQLQVVFQDPYSSLNPTRTVGQTLRETLRVHRGVYTKDEIDGRISTMLGRVGLPADAEKRYPAHFSGGQRQRIAIARALMVQPRLVVCDEPMSALDLSVQAQALNLLRELQNEFELSYLFIAHDLAVVKHLSHRIVVLYRGRIMEQGTASVVHERPSHPYTQMLLESAPVPDPALQRRRRATRPNLRAHESAGPYARAGDGCPFSPRCPHAIKRCWSERPALELTTSGALVACHRWRDLES